MATKSENVFDNLILLGVGVFLFFEFQVWKSVWFWGIVFLLVGIIVLGYIVGAVEENKKQTVRHRTQAKSVKPKIKAKKPKKCPAVPHELAKFSNLIDGCRWAEHNADITLEHVCAFILLRRHSVTPMSDAEKDVCFNVMLESFGSKQDFYDREWQNPEFFRLMFGRLGVVKDKANENVRRSGEYRDRTAPRDGWRNPPHEPYDANVDDAEWV